MDVGEEKYRRVIAQYKPYLANIIAQYPIDHNSKLAKHRNLAYLTTRYELMMNLPYSHEIYEETLIDIKNSIKDTSYQSKMLGLRLARALPFIHRIRFIEESQNVPMWQLSKLAVYYLPRNARKFLNTDACELLLSVYELTKQSEDIYFDVNQRIISVLSRLAEQALAGDREQYRNGCEILRTIAHHRTIANENTIVHDSSVMGVPQGTHCKLIIRIVSLLCPSNSFLARSISSSNTKLLQLIMRVREYEVRMRPRLYYGYCKALSWLPNVEQELTALLIRELFVVLENINECDVAIESFQCLSALLDQQLSFHTRANVLRRWVSLIYQIPYKKEYLQYYVYILGQSTILSYGIPLRLCYELSIRSLQLTKHLSGQYTRFVIYHLACSNLIRIARLGYSAKQKSPLLLNIFQYSWFIDRINQDHDLFKSEFMISLLHAFMSEHGQPSKQETVDLIALCHRLIDWRCASKEETHVPTFKFAFDFYLVFLVKAGELLGPAIENSVVELIERCNQQSIYFLFKLKLISTLLSLPWYQSNAVYLQRAKLNLDFIEGQIRPFMMPKNPKPIFQYSYSLQVDGEIESRKEIECIKIIMDLLDRLPKVHEQVQQLTTSITIDYHQYLSQLQTMKTSNTDLINCLQTLEADHYLSQCQRNFLFGLMDFTVCKHNCELNMDSQILSSPHETFDCDQEINVFGPMSPVHLTVRLAYHESYSSVYLHIRKNQWVIVSGLKLVVSSGLEKKQMPFQSCILEIKIDRIGGLHFQVWSTEGEILLLGSGNYRIRRKIQWRRVDHLKIIDGIHSKAYFKMDRDDPRCRNQTYLGYCYGQPILIQIVRKNNQIVVSVTNKQVWNQIREAVSDFVEQLVDGSAEIL